MGYYDGDIFNYVYYFGGFIFIRCKNFFWRSDLKYESEVLFWWIVMELICCLFRWCSLFWFWWICLINWVRCIRNYNNWFWFISNYWFISIYYFIVSWNCCRYICCFLLWEGNWLWCKFICYFWYFYFEFYFSIIIYISICYLIWVFISSFLGYIWIYGIVIFCISVRINCSDYKICLF